MEAGTYKVYVGTQQPDKRSQHLTGKTPECMTVSVDQPVVLENAAFKESRYANLRYIWQSQDRKIQTICIN